jgi:1-phosphatidylinositol phosphodiesterase
LDTYAKDTYGRGAGSVLTCAADTTPSTPGFCCPREVTSAYYHDTANLPARTRWMSGLPSCMPLRRLSIPGTHDSGTFRGTRGLAAAINDGVQCQTLTIDQQLYAGVRFLDIRIGSASESPNTLTLFHGAFNVQVGLEEALASIRTFLASNPLEVVLMRAKKESYSGSAFGTDLRRYLAPHSDLVYDVSASNATLSTLTLGDARGRLIILQVGGCCRCTLQWE